MNSQALSSFIWSVADLLRGDYKQSEYGRVILPFTVLRRLDCVLEATKPVVLAEHAARTQAGLNPEPFLLRKTGVGFYNASPLDLPTLLGDQDHIRQNLYAYLQAFSPAARDIFERFDFHAQVERLAKADLLYLVTEKFARIDLHPDAVDNATMGSVFEELIRKFAEISNETAGEHFTPREVIRLMVNLLFIEDSEVLAPGRAVVRTVYDPTAGTGGMLSVAAEHLLAHNPQARLTMFGQELNDESFAICKADMLIKGQDVANIVCGNTLSDDGHAQRQFDYMLANPPFGVEWKKVERQVRQEHELKGFDGRFGPGLPRVSDGSMLFLLHLVSKMRPPAEGGSRFGIVLNGSPLFTGGAGSGESEIRRYLLENDLVESIVGLPTDMFYNTGIATYVWIVSNRKPEDRRGFVQLIDASGFWQKMRKSLGSKRREMSDEHIATVTRLFGDFAEAEQVTVLDAQGQPVGEPRLVTGTDTAPRPPEGGRLKRVPIARIFRNEEFGYTTITVDRPMPDYVPNFNASDVGSQFYKVTEREYGILKRRVADHSVKAFLDYGDYDLNGIFVVASFLFKDNVVCHGRDEFIGEIKKRSSFLKKPISDRDILMIVNLCAPERDRVRENKKSLLKIKKKPDASRRETENIPLGDDIYEYFAKNVLPHAPDAWIDEKKTKIGYEIPFNRHFYVFEPPRSLHTIDEELKAVSVNIMKMLGDLAE